MCGQKRYFPSAQNRQRRRGMKWGEAWGQAGGENRIDEEFQHHFAIIF